MDNRGQHDNKRRCQCSSKGNVKVGGLDITGLGQVKLDSVTTGYLSQMMSFLPEILHMNV